MPFHRPARSTLALLTASVLLPLGAARAATTTTSTTSSGTPTTTTVAQPTSETTTASTSTQTATSFSTSSSTTSAPTASTTTTTATTTQTTSTHGRTRWSRSPHGHGQGQDLVIGVSRRAHTASDPTDTISDFKFAPATITIHVGDTITWVNNGPAPHTATANNGSFDTGNLNKGQSASHTFTQAGTFAYICKIHPFMHGTVVVLAAASSSGPGSSTGSGSSAGSSGSAAPTATTSSTAPVTSTGGLPNTGMNLLGAVGAGLLLAGGGIALRRRLSQG